MADAECLTNSNGKIVLESVPPIVTQRQSQTIISPYTSQLNSPTHISTQNLDNDFSDTY